MSRHFGLLLVCDIEDGKSLCLSHVSFSFNGDSQHELNQLCRRRRRRRWR